MSGKTVLVFVCVVFGLVSAKIPDYIHICKRSDPHVSKCIRESIEVLKPRLKTGIPEINVPSLEPLHIDEIVIGNGQGPSHFKAILKNIQVYGASDFQLTRLKVDTVKHIYRVGVKIPVLRLIGDYDVDAQILVVPIRGAGKFTANATTIEGQGLLKAAVDTGSDGGRAFRFTSFDLALRILDYSIKLEDLFGGDPVLGKAANDLLNDNKEEFIHASLPFLQRKVSEILLEIAGKITKGLDYDEAFPEK